MSAFGFFIVRDLTILAMTVGVWIAATATEAGQILAGGLAGLCALLFHEYGHLLGAYLAGAKVQAAPKWSPFVFNLNPAQNTRRQLLTTSIGGFVATAIFLLVFFFWLPLHLLSGQIALAIGCLLASLTVIIEFPIAWRMARGYAVPDLSIFRELKHDRP